MAGAFHRGLQAILEKTLEADAGKRIGHQPAIQYGDEAHALQTFDRYRWAEDRFPIPVAEKFADPAEHIALSPPVRRRILEWFARSPEPYWEA